MFSIKYKNLKNTKVAFLFLILFIYNIILIQNEYLHFYGYTKPWAFIKIIYFDVFILLFIYII